MGKKEQDIAVAAREVLVGALGDALFAKRDWLGVAENLADQVAREYQSRMDETSGLLKMLGDLGKRLERAERRLEHYRRKGMHAHEIARRAKNPFSAPVGYNAGFAAIAKTGNRKLTRWYLEREAAARRALHAQGKGVP